MVGAGALQTLVAIEQGFAARRARLPDIPAAVDDVLGDPSLRITRAAPAAHALAVEVQQRAAPEELPYHNRHHVAETVLAMGLLASVARADGLIGADMAALGVAAMVGHDQGHDGSPVTNGRLERLAVALSLPVLGAAGLDPAGLDIVTEVILATDPARVAENAARAAGSLPGDPRGPGFDLLCQLANEADVFVSLLPARGWRMGAALAAEWRAAGCRDADAVASFSGRLAFLRRYRQFSPPAERLGLARVVGQQVAAFAWGAASPEDGAAALDRMPRRVAYRRYMDALRGLEAS
jgi:hypothetical protein